MGNKELLEHLGINLTRIKSSGKTLCPKCSHTRKKKNDPCLSVNVELGTYNCHNVGCDFSGGVSVQPYEPKPKEYIRPPKFVNNTSVSNYLVNWFFKRGISQKTINAAMVSESRAWMPQTQKDEYTINFNYFRDGELINVKYRNSKEKHFRMVKDAELIFYGLDDIKGSDWCCIVEGECDKLAFLESGVKEVISVPNGASKGGNLEYLDNCISYFENKVKIILATDTDEPGIALREELARRLGHERCFKASFNDCKDANEYLTKYGSQKLKERLSEPNLVSYPIDGVITADMMWDEMEDMFVNGLSKGAVTEMLSDLDDHLSIVQGQLMVLTGIPNHGKSPFALMIMCCLSLKHRWKWAMFSPEHKPLKIFMAKVCEMLLGKHMRKGVGFTQREKDLCRSFIGEHFFFIEPEDENYSLDNILDKAKKLVTQKGIKGLIIDPWNKLEHNIVKGDNETNYISKELDKVIKFNQRNSVFSIIVAHPTKIRKIFKSSLHEVPTLYDISGSSNWFNKPDIGVTFYRNFDTKQSEVYIQKMKYEHLGKQGMVRLRYNMNNGRFNNIYGEWDNSNWLIPDGQQVEMATPEPVNQPVFDPNDTVEELPF